MKAISDYLNTAPDSIKIDWSAVEEKLGFKIRDELKAFYSRGYYKTEGHANTVCGIFDVSDSTVTIPSGNERFDKWFSSNECEDSDREIYLRPIPATVPAEDFIVAAFRGWRGKELQCGEKAHIGEFDVNIGEILLLFDNETGKVEWADFGFGNFSDFSEIPHGVFANSMDDFVKKMLELEHDYEKPHPLSVGEVVFSQDLNDTKEPDAGNIVASDEAGSEAVKAARDFNAKVSPKISFTDIRGGKNKNYYVAFCPEFNKYFLVYTDYEITTDYVRRVYFISRDEYMSYGSKKLDDLAEELNSMRNKTERFLCSEYLPENTPGQFWILKNCF